MMRTQSTKPELEPLRVYWQPGCTGCLRMKEFLTAHGVEFISVNVLVDRDGLEELMKLSGRHVPIARRGSDWVDGQVLADLARIAGIPWGATPMLPPSELVDRAQAVLSAAERLTRQIPEPQLDLQLPDRPRSFRQLVAHIAQIVEAFLDLVEHGKRLEYAAYNQDVPAAVTSKADLLSFVESARHRLQSWWRDRGHALDYSANADVYYGTQSLHEFLERSTWHSAQHTRQLALVVEGLGIRPDRPLGDAELAGLPLPTHAWDDKLEFSVPGAAPPGANVSR
jgi:hypothetical protein